MIDDQYLIEATQSSEQQGIRFSLARAYADHIRNRFQPMQVQGNAIKISVHFAEGAVFVQHLPHAFKSLSSFGGRQIIQAIFP